MPEQPDIDTMAKRLGVVITSISARSRRPDCAESDWGEGATHFYITLARGDEGRTIWKGFYSVGSAFPDRWAEKGCKVPDHAIKAKRDRGLTKINPVDNIAQRAFSNRKRESKNSRYWHRHNNTIKARFAALGPISAGDVLGSLIMESIGADQPFEDWAADYGYSDDSMSAKKIWEEVNETRRALQASFDPDTLAQLYEVEI